MITAARRLFVELQTALRERGQAQVAGAAGHRRPAMATKAWTEWGHDLPAPLHDTIVDLPAPLHDTIVGANRCSSWRGSRASHA